MQQLATLKHFGSIHHNRFGSIRLIFWLAGAITHAELCEINLRDRHEGWMVMNDPKGSVWRKWDLHVHSPASYDYQDRSVKANEIVDCLVTAGVEVVAITDHHVIDINFIREMQNYGRGKLTVLPGIELRSELGGSEHVHYVGIFPEDCDLNDVWIKLQSLGISTSDVQREGDERVYVPMPKGCEKIRELGGIVTIHAGKKSNSIEQLANAEKFKQAIKKDLATKYGHALEVGRVEDCEDYKNIVFKAIDKEFPLIICSDNHNIRNYSTRCPLWVKADPNFLGLLQISHEPEDRIFLGDIPPSTVRVEQDATKYITSVSFCRTEFAEDKEKWFCDSVTLNPGLVAIIGNKGGGKSALADILALAGNTHASKHFSFLNDERFLSPKQNLGQMFSAVVSWKSGHEVPFRLDRQCDVNAPELVKYVPQSYLEKICTELKEGTGSFFDQELKEVIFSHVSEADRLGHPSLDNLIAYLTNETEDHIQQLIGELADLNKTINSLEEQATEEYGGTLRSRLDQKMAELRALELAKPKEIPKPDLDAETQAALQKITTSLNELQKRLQEIDKAIEDANKRDRTATGRVAAADKLLERMANLERSYNIFLRDSVSDGNILGIDVKTLVDLKIDKATVDAAKTAAIEERKQARDMLDSQAPTSLSAQRSSLTHEIDRLRLQLDEPNRRYQTYLDEMKKWDTKRNVLIGSPYSPDTIGALEANIAGLAELPNKIKDNELKRDVITGQIFEAKQQLLTRYRDLYAPVQLYIQNHRLAQESSGLEFQASVAVEGFSEEFLAMIHHGRKGSFSGDDEGQLRLRNLVAAADFTSQDGVLGFVTLILRQLREDVRETPPKPVRLKDQLRQNFKPTQVYDFLFGLEYLRPRFELRWQGKALDQLSPGERGNLLLTFYLLIDRRDTPLIIDQPEENLDNQTVAKMLVPSIKEAKERRQIIMVTHNPNLVVVCDADQVIHAKLDKSDGNSLVYTSGAIENPTITEFIVDVLEGTKRAFDIRDAKYEILELYKRAREAIPVAAQAAPA